MILSILENTLYFLALINPASKILFLSARKHPYSHAELLAISLKSSLVAWVILAFLISCGKFLLGAIFHVEIYSLSVAGGVILFIIGLNAVRYGQFHEKREFTSVADISIVPLAAPLIAGPGVMTAAMSFVSIHGVTMTFLCVTLAILINLLFMLASLKIGSFLERVNATGTLVRITGLVVSAVAMQMIFSGCGIWINKIL